jgi:hypothetical protein
MGVRALSVYPGSNSSFNRLGQEILTERMIEADSLLRDCGEDPSQCVIEGIPGNEELKKGPTSMVGP